MVANRRVWYAVQSVGLAPLGTNTFTMMHGIQSVGMNLKFNLLAVFELSQASVYDQPEDVPDLEVTLTKCLDGYCPIYLQATNGSTSASLAGRSNARTTVGLSIYTDTQDSASGTAVAQCYMSGMYVSAISYDLPVDGPYQESVTLVGNNRTWSKAFTAGAFNNLDAPLALSGSGGVNRRQDLLLGEQAGNVCRFPTDINGVSSSGYVAYDTVNQFFAVHTQSIKVSTNLGREQIHEQGKKGPYYRYVNFPVEVTTDFEVLSAAGDNVAADENALSNVNNQTIKLYIREGTVLDLGAKNKLTSVTTNGGNAGQNGGNATSTYAYRNYSDLKVTHPQDPSGLS